jgi:MFS family permease
VCSYFWGPVADIFGRRKAFIFSAAIISIAGLASGLAPTYMYLLALRGLVGFGLGGSSVPFDLLAEFCPPKQRYVRTVRTWSC